MKRLALLVTCVLLALPGSAGAAPPVRDRQIDTGSVVTDYGCGFPVRVEWNDVDLIKTWTTPNGGSRLADHGQSVEVYTNTVTGRSLTLTSNLVVTDYRSTPEIEIGTVAVFALRGVNFRVKTANGNVVSSGSVHEASRVVEIVRDPSGFLYITAEGIRHNGSTPHLIHFIPWLEENLCRLLAA